MAITVAVTRQAHSLGELRSYGTITFDSSYLTGGEPTVPNSFKLGDANFDLRVYPAAGYMFEHDKTAKTIIAYTPGVTTGATTAADVTSGALILGDAGTEGAFRAMGTAVSTTYKFGAQKEVTSAVNLSAVVAKFEAVGAY